MNGLDPLLVMAVAGAVVMAVGVALALRAWLKLAPAEQAFIALSLRMGLGRRSRSVLRQMAADSGIAPVALLLSPTAFDTASASVKTSDERSARLVQRLRARVAP